MNCKRDDQPLSQFESVAEGFLLDRTAQGISKGTIRLYAKEIGYFREFLKAQGINAIEEVTAVIIRQYMVELSAHRNAGGCHLAYRIIKSLTYWWESELDGDYTSPVRKVNPPKLPKKLLPPVERDDIRAMLDACKGPNAARDKAILYCLLDTGCRANEFLSINLEDTNIGKGSIYISRGKGGKDRTVFIGKPSRKALRAYLKGRNDKDPALWVSEEGTRLTYWGLRQIIRRVAVRAGLEKEPSLHSFRRAFVVAMLAKRVNVMTLRNLMGHADLRVLERYANQNELELGRAHEDGSPSDLIDED